MYKHLFKGVYNIAQQIHHHVTHNHSSSVDWDAVDRHYASYCLVHEHKPCGNCPACLEIKETTQKIEQDKSFHFKLNTFHKEIEAACNQR